MEITTAKTTYRIETRCYQGSTPAAGPDPSDCEISEVIDLATNTDADYDAFLADLADHLGCDIDDAEDHLINRAWDSFEDQIASEYDRY